MVVLGLRFCARAFYLWLCWVFVSVRGLSLVAASGGHSSSRCVGLSLSITVSLVAEHRLQTHRLSNCGSQAQLLRGMWDLPRPGLEPVSPALAGRLSTTVPPGKPCCIFKQTWWGKKKKKKILLWLFKRPSTDISPIIFYVELLHNTLSLLHTNKYIPQQLLYAILDYNNIFVHHMHCLKNVSFVQISLLG